jgi:hypothetical protein
MRTVGTLHAPSGLLVPRDGEYPCHWCRFPVRADDTRVEENLTPFELDMPYGGRGFWCNGSCCASWFRTFRPRVTVDVFTAMIRKALGHPDDTFYDCAPEPFDYEWFTLPSVAAKRAPFSSKTRADYLARCYHRSPATGEIFSKGKRAYDPASTGFRALFSRQTPPRAHTPAPGDPPGALPPDAEASLAPVVLSHEKPPANKVPAPSPLKNARPAKRARKHR